MESPSGEIVFRTKRLVLRRWQEGDAEALAATYADPDIMRYIPGGVWSLERTKQIIARMSQLERDNGFGFYPVIRAGDECILGHCGLGRLENGDEIEVAYVLGKAHWGYGYASEAASATIDHAFRTGVAQRIVAVAFPENFRSTAVMHRIGMRRVGRAQHFGAELEKYEITPASRAPAV
ncbi:MAG TPA: GNAT family N-acetyltransferase [Candidatus Tumulicola sp.]|jgi:RimJ/RimL family protein N-acetyltransferase